MKSRLVLWGPKAFMMSPLPSSSPRLGSHFFWASARQSHWPNERATCDPALESLPLWFPSPPSPFVWLTLLQVSVSVWLLQRDLLWWPIQRIPHLHFRLWQYPVYSFLALSKTCHYFITHSITVLVRTTSMFQTGVEVLFLPMCLSHPAYNWWSINICWLNYLIKGH